MATCSKFVSKTDAGTSAVAKQAMENAFSRLLGDSEFSLSTPRIERAKECVRYFQTKEDAAEMVEFADKVWRNLTSIADKSLVERTKSHSKRRVSLWKSFYQFRSAELIVIWEELLAKVQLPQNYHPDPWLPQVIARLVIEAIVKDACSVEPEICDLQPLDADEHNALRYAAGYVLRSVKEKYTSRNPAVVVWINQQRLSTATDTDSGSGDYLQFTREWVEKVNRGGLFIISDPIYMVFHSMENVLRQYLHQLSGHDHKMDKETVIKYIHDDNDVQFHWCMVAVELSEELSQEVLKNIVQLWVTIRGFSVAGALVEEYKICCGTLKGKKALRKDLKRKSSDTYEE